MTSQRPCSLVWSSASFIGEHLVRQLAALGQEVRGDEQPSARCVAVYVVNGDERIVRAAVEAGCRRIVCTAPARPVHCPTAVFVQPTNVVGPGDTEPTPIGRLITRFLNGRIPFYVDRPVNLIAVEDVAAGYILAGERGAAGRCYVLAHRDLMLREVYQMLAELTGLPMPIVRWPHWFTGRRPPSTNELELPHSSVKNALARAICWFSRHGCVKRPGFDVSADVLKAIESDAPASSTLSPPGGPRV